MAKLTTWTRMGSGGSLTPSERLPFEGKVTSAGSSPMPGASAWGRSGPRYSGTTGEIGRVAARSDFHVPESQREHQRGATHSAPAAPLGHLRVVDLTRFRAGPYCS